MRSADLQRRSMIKVRGGFSDTKGIMPYSTGIQIDEFDDRTRNVISNYLYDALISCLNDYGHLKFEMMNLFCKKTLTEVFGENNRMEFTRSYDFDRFYEDKINDVIQNAVYNEVLDLIWYICTWVSNKKREYNGETFKKINGIFERESVGYRFVSGNIVPITDPIEIEEIEQAAENKFEGCRNHIKKAVEYLSNREIKDYKNVIKESISAVESICKVITGNESATLGDALKVLSKKHDLNPQLKAAFEKFYAYTNGPEGIRHADGLFTSEVTFEEAKFMLISCSAFVNYLISEYGKTM